MLKTKVDDQNGIAILSLTGKITISGGDVMLREAILSLLNQGKQNMVLDLEGVSHIDSSGIGELVSAFTKVQNQGGFMKLSAVPRKVMDILQITQLVRVFDIHDTTAEAIDSF